MKEVNYQAVVVGFTDDFIGEKRKIVKTENMTIVVAKAANSYYAFRNECPHQGASLAYGAITGAMKPSEPHEYEYGCHNQIIRCPLHGWAFNANTGRSLFSDKVKIKTFDVKEDNGSIILYLKKKEKVIKIDFVSSMKC